MQTTLDQYMAKNANGAGLHGVLEARGRTREKTLTVETYFVESGERRGREINLIRSGDQRYNFHYYFPKPTSKSRLLMKFMEMVGVRGPKPTSFTYPNHPLKYHVSANDMATVVAIYKTRVSPKEICDLNSANKIRNFAGVKRLLA